MYVRRTERLLKVGLVLLCACRTAPADRSDAIVPSTVSDSSTQVVDARSPSIDAGDGQDASSAPGGFVCVPPLAGDLERCPKGAMAGDDALRECLRREAQIPAKRPTFRVAGSASSTFSPTHWRCAEVALDAKIHVTIDTIAGLDETVPSTCGSHAIDMVGPNQYGAIFFRCSHRAREGDELVERE